MSEAAHTNGVGSHHQILAITRINSLSQQLTLATVQAPQSAPELFRYPAPPARRRLPPRGQPQALHSVIDLMASTLGLKDSIVKTRWTSFTDWSLSVQQALPPITLLSRYALDVRLNARTFPLCRSISLMSGTGFAFSRIVDGDSALMEACKHGDVNIARRLLYSREAYVTDVSRVRWGPLPVSLSSPRLREP